MKIAVLNDIHASTTKRSNRLHSNLVFDGLATTISHIQKHTPDLVLVLGDLIQNTDEEHDKKMLEAVLNTLDPIKHLCRVASGNHEGRGLGLEYLTNTLQEKGFNNQIYGTFENNGTAALYVSTSENRKNGVRNDFLPENQVRWLAETLDEITVPTLIFSHHFLTDIPHQHNFYIEVTGSNNTTISNNDEVQAILSKHSKKIKASICAHSHWLAFDSTKNIPIISLPSYSENIMSEVSDNLNPHVWSLVDWDGKQVKVNSFSGRYSWGQIRF